MTETDNTKYFQSIFPTFFRYIILIILYFFSFFYIFNNSSQFVIFILVFILNFFGGVFVIRDIFVNEGVLLKFSDTGTNLSLLADPPLLLKLFIFALVIGLLGQFICLVILMVVFDYGKQNKTDLVVYKMSSKNNYLLYNFKQFFIYCTTLIWLLTFLIVFSYSDEITRNLLRNLLGTGISIGIFGFVSYELFLVVEFLKTKQRRAPLYQ